MGTRERNVLYCSIKADNNFIIGIRQRANEISMASNSTKEKGNPSNHRIYTKKRSPFPFFYLVRFLYI